MSSLSRLERFLGRFAIPNLALYLVIGQVAVLGLALFGRIDAERLSLWPAAVLGGGEWWRVITFLFVPPVGQLTMTSAIFLAFAWYMFYMMGSALEHYWGAFRFNLFILVGWFLTVAVAFIFPGAHGTNLFLAGSVFLAFAFLNPDFELVLFFILPVKIKWLALIQWLFYAFTLVMGNWPARFMVLASVGNFLLFFSRDLVEKIRGNRRRMEHQSRHARSQASAEREPRHRCHVCGKTDLTHPQMDFRYCSKCAGEECYCADHIHNHVHTIPKP